MPVLDDFLDELTDPLERLLAEEFVRLLHDESAFAEDYSARMRANFAHPAHHTEVGYTVPTRTNIQPHIDRMRQLLQYFGLIS